MARLAAMVLDILPGRRRRPRRAGRVHRTRPLGPRHPQSRRHAGVASRLRKCADRLRRENGRGTSQPAVLRGLLGCRSLWRRERHAFGAVCASTERPRHTDAPWRPVHPGGRAVLRQHECAGRARYLDDAPGQFHRGPERVGPGDVSRHRRTRRAISPVRRRPGAASNPTVSAICFLLPSSRHRNRLPPTRSSRSR
jgi:hypothetical protein